MIDDGHLHNLNGVACQASEWLAEDGRRKEGGMWDVDKTAVLMSLLVQICEFVN